MMKDCNSHMQHLLASWYEQRDCRLWVLGTVFKVSGSSYRRPGAFMLLNDLGQRYGLLSGGCLEANIHQQAARVMYSQKPKILCYDSSDEDDISNKLKIGCGGKINILLHLITARQNYLGLNEMYGDLLASRGGYFFQAISEIKHDDVAAFWIAEDDPGLERSGLSKTDQSILTQARGGARICKLSDKDSNWLVSVVKPVFHLLIVGGGMDARPLAAMASQLGWKVTLCDPRPANARREHFCEPIGLLKCDINELVFEAELSDCNAAVVMTHNLVMDASAIQVLQNFSLDYLALLGPLARKEKVLKIAGLSGSPLTVPVNGPAGLDVGAELPEGVALSILSECHAVLHQADGLPLNSVNHAGKDE